MQTRAKLFEHFWFTDPVWSMVRTFRLAVFHPGRFWSLYDPNDPPVIISLLFLAALQVLFFLKGWEFVAFWVDPLMNWLGTIFLNPNGRPASFIYTSRISPNTIVETCAWYIATFLALLIFLQDKGGFLNRCRQTLRVYAHVTLVACLATGSWCLLEAAVDCYYFVSPIQAVPVENDLSQVTPPDRVGPAENPPPFRLGRGRPVRRIASVPQWIYPLLGKVVFAVALASIWILIWAGYRYYFRMSHGWAIATVSMFTGWIATRVLFDVILV